eukprot:COSAG06_NODE_3815_length_4878_cov_7.893933_3_plen_175_part_00
MNRFLGSSKPKAPAPTLGDQQGLQQKRIDDLQGRVRKLDSELVKYREQLKKTRPGTSAHNNVKRRAMQLMKQRKMYDQQLGQMMDMEFNVQRDDGAGDDRVDGRELTRGPHGRDTQSASWNVVHAAGRRRSPHGRTVRRKAACRRQAFNANALTCHAWRRVFCFRMPCAFPLGD